MTDEQPQIIQICTSAATVENRTEMVHVALFSNSSLAWQKTCGDRSRCWARIKSPDKIESSIRQINVSSSPRSYFSEIILTVLFGNSMVAWTKLNDYEPVWTIIDPPNFKDFC